jgi:tRNA threonylcarbamoyladenosine biosynthesis protein TsaE
MISKGVKDTFEIAKDFLAKILNKKEDRRGAKVVALSGDLGAGKTAFTKAVAEILGIKERVNSPTFVIMKKYKIDAGGYKFLFHVDAYRLEGGEDLEKLGWREVLESEEHLVFIEWPERVKSAIPQDAHRVEISHLGGEERNFDFK